MSEIKNQQLLWLSDPHIDFLQEERVDLLLNQLASKRLPIILGGDIADGSRAFIFLKELSSKIQNKIYFVLGNHDYYGSSINSTRKRAHDLSQQYTNLCYLTTSGVHEVFKDVALIGHDGLADALEGDFFTSSIVIRDYREIEELRSCSRDELKLVLKDLGAEAADAMREKLLQAFKRYQSVIIVMHAPPFRDACLYEGKVTSDNWAPHFVCRSIGDMLLEELSRYVDKRCLVLAGHSHHIADITPLANLRVVVSSSEYLFPSVVCVDKEMLPA